MDIDILVWIADHRLPFLDKLFSFITLFSEEVLLIALVCGMYWCFNKRRGVYLLFSLFFGLLFNQFAKLIFQIPRPWLRDSRLHPVESAMGRATGPSFPSGHTASAVSVYGGVANLAPKEKKGFRIALWALVALIGFSRLYLGVHTPQDVLVSLVVGIGLLALVRRLMRYLDQNPRADRWIALGGIMISLALLVYVRLWTDDVNSLDEVKIAGCSLAVFTGWVAERRYVQFTADHLTIKQIAIRLVGGLILTLFVLKGLKAPLIGLAGESIGGFIRYFLTGFVIILGWPWLFQRMHW